MFDNNLLLRSKSGLNYNRSHMKKYLNMDPSGRRVSDSPENPYILDKD